MSLRLAQHAAALSFVISVAAISYGLGVQHGKGAAVWTGGQITIEVLPDDAPDPIDATTNMTTL